MSLDNADEKLWVAVSILSASDQSLRDRLFDALFEGAMRVKVGDLPEGCRGDFQAMIDMVTAVDGPEGSFRASLNAMSDQELKEIAKVIIRTHKAVTAAIGE
jgi:hypothetical protein